MVLSSVQNIFNILVGKRENKRLSRLLLLITWLIAFGLQAQEIHSTVTLDTTDGTLGDVFHVSWVVDHPADAVLEFPLLDTQVATFEVLEQGNAAPRPTASIKQFTVAVYDSVGPHDFPNQTGFVITGDDTHKINLPGFRINIHSVLTGQDSTFRSIKPLHDVRLPFNWWILFWIILVTILGYLAYRFLPRRRHRAHQKKTKIVIIPPEDAHLVALRELNALGETDFLIKGEFKLFYSVLTTIIRRYFEHRFLIDALEMTTSEVLQALESGVMDSDETRATKIILEKGDLVKFAKYIPEVRDAEASLVNAINIVEATKVLHTTSNPKSDKKPPINVEDKHD